MKRQIKIINPSIGKIIGRVFQSSEAEVKRIISLARKRFFYWSNAPFTKRKKLIKEFTVLLMKEKSNFSDLINEGVGKITRDSLREVEGVEVAMNYYCHEIEKIKEKKIKLSDWPAATKTKAIVKFVPHGVVGVITPWNFPLLVPVWTFIPALLTGNVVVFKPSEYSLLVGKKIYETADKIFPKGVFNIVYGGPEIGKILVKEKIDKLFFTGSTEAGLDILKNIGIKPVNLELGGDDSAIVCSDANIELAVRGIAWGAFHNAGQVCVSVKNIYVCEPIAAEFIGKIIKETKKLKYGVDFGPLIDKRHLEKIEKTIKDEVLSGAKVLLGGKRIKGSGFFFEPTILINIKKKKKAMEKESFGPVLTVYTVKNEEEAAKWINRSDFGLGVSIWTKDVKKGEQLSNMIDVGMVWINDVVIPLPGGDYWGGAKISGPRSAESKLMQCLKAKSLISNYDGKRSWWSASSKRKPDI